MHNWLNFGDSRDKVVIFCSILHAPNVQSSIMGKLRIQNVCKFEYLRSGVLYDQMTSKPLKTKMINSQTCSIEISKICNSLPVF